jgi:hypothetical protein
MSAGETLPAGQGDSAPPSIAHLVDPYDPYVNLTQAFTPEQQELLKQHRLTSFDTGGAIALALFVGTLFTGIFYGLKSDDLPKVKEDDPSAGKFIGFFFIPIFGWFIWPFTAWNRLVDRINFQYRLRGAPPRIDRSKVNLTLIMFWLGFLTFVTWIVSLVYYLQLVSQTQDAINGLAAERGSL